MSIVTDRLTNTEIFNTTDKRLLTGIQKQIRFLMEQHMSQKACPNCGEPHNLPEAAGVDVDDYDFGSGASGRGDRIGSCRKCKRTLIFTLPFIGDWHWRLDPEEAKV